MTPVEPGYFEHLEKIRGKAKKLKVTEDFRASIANGSTDLEQMGAAGSGHVDANSEHFSTTQELVKNGQDDGDGNHRQTEMRRPREKGENTLPREQMDISLHNFGDYARS